MKEYLLYTNDPFEKCYRVQAEYALDAAEIVAVKIGKSIDYVKETYTPVLINEVEKINYI